MVAVVVCVLSSKSVSQKNSGNREDVSVSVLIVFVDYDNIEPGLRRAGPVNLAKIIVSLISTSILSRFDEVVTRLYGGWRSRGTLTTSAQRLVPVIRAESPVYVPVLNEEAARRIRITVELADKPIGTRIPLSETLVMDRGLRKFRARRVPWNDCTHPGACGLSSIIRMTHATECGNSGCSTRMGDVLVRDEQKMVDTLLVADIAYLALSDNASDLVVVSSDTDMWPGILLALRASCSVTHIHTRSGWKTQRHLLSTLSQRQKDNYHQLSV